MADKVISLTESVSSTEKFNDGDNLKIKAAEDLQKKLISISMADLSEIFIFNYPPAAVKELIEAIAPILGLKSKDWSSLKKELTPKSKFAQILHGLNVNKLTLKHFAKFDAFCKWKTQE